MGCVALVVPVQTETIRKLASSLERTFDFAVVPQFAIVPELLLRALLSSPALLGDAGLPQSSYVTESVPAVNVMRGLLFYQKKALNIPLNERHSRKIVDR